MSLNPLMLEDFVLEGRDYCSPVAWMIGRVIQMLEESKTQPIFAYFQQKALERFLESTYVSIKARPERMNRWK